MKKLLILIKWIIGNWWVARISYEDGIYLYNSFYPELRIFKNISTFEVAHKMAYNLNHN